MKEKTQESEKPTLKTFLSWLGIYVLVFALVLVACLFCIRAINNSFRYYPVRGTSMQPTINPDVVYGREEDMVQDGVFVKVTQDVEYNDIIIIQKDPQDDYTIIKRVIATGGDKVAIIKNEFVANKQTEEGLQPDGLYHSFVIRDGQEQVEMLEEDFVDPDDKWQWTISASAKTDSTWGASADVQYEGQFYDKFFASANQNHIVKVDCFGQSVLFYQLAQDEVFYLGDHRSVSADARHNGPTKRSNIVGKVVSIIKDADDLDKKGVLWWIKLTTLLSYYWGNLEEYFAW